MANTNSLGTSDQILLKRRGDRLIEKVTICVEPELKRLYDECATEAHIQDGIRAFMRTYLKDVKARIERERLLSDEAG